MVARGINRTEGEHAQDYRIIELREEGNSIESIAFLMGLSDSYVQKRITYLSKKGIVKKIRRGRKTGSEVVLMPEVQHKPKSTLGHSCRYPDCRMKAEYNFALVDLCGNHFEAIVDETTDYYRKNGKGCTYADRKLYLRIANQIPWVNLSEVQKCDL